MQKMKWTVAAALLSPLALAPLAAAYIPGYAVSRGSSAADRPGGHDTDGNGATIMAINVADVKSFDPVARALTCQPVNGQAACGGATDIVLVKTDNGGSGIW